ncbi:MAG: hypothetical protein ACTSRK_04505 [Promethearchaeota archaeon]
MSSHRISKEERAKKMEALKRQQEEKQKTVDAAEAALDSAKGLVKKNKFDEAKDKYLEAAQNFRKIKWDNEADLCETEAKNMELKRQKINEQLALIEKRKMDEQDEFDQRAAKILAEKEEKIRLQELEKQKLSPQLQRKIDETESMLEKAKIRESKGKWKQAIQRYQFVLESYKELEKPEDKIEEIREKIEELTKKVSL